MTMDTYNPQVMELRSLGTLPDGSFQMMVGITRQDRQVPQALAIDEFTYRQLDALQLLSEGRVRLSPYPRWDPYRTGYYCTAVRSTDTRRETLYFACSEAFKAQLERLRQAKELHAPCDEEARGRAGAGAAAGQPGRRRMRRMDAHVAIAAVRALVVGFLFVYLCSCFGAGQLKDDAAAMNMPIAVVKAAETAPTAPAAVRAAAERAADAAPAALVKAGEDAAAEAQYASASAEQTYEIIEIDGPDSFFGLPKEYVALTFDDGPSPYTEQIVDILREHETVATFLFVGRNAERNPDAVAYASKHGMSIGNHSWDHSVLTKVDAEDQGDNLAKTSALLESLTGKPVTLFRPPYGAINNGLASSAERLKMKILLWNRDPEDWHAKRPEDILDYFREVQAPGGVYVLHEDKNTVEALPEIIAYLKKNDLTFAAFK